jgi:hypothetical protein
VLLAGASDLQVVVACELQGIADVVFTRDAYDPINGSLVKVASVVDEAFGSTRRTVGFS